MLPFTQKELYSFNWLAGKSRNNCESFAFLIVTFASRWPIWIQGISDLLNDTCSLPQQGFCMCTSCQYCIYKPLQYFVKHWETASVVISAVRTVKGFLDWFRPLHRDIRLVKYVYPKFVPSIWVGYCKASNALLMSMFKYVNHPLDICSFHSHFLITYFQGILPITTGTYWLYSFFLSRNGIR